MKALTDPIKELGIYDDLVRSLRKRGITGVTGLVDSARTMFSFALSEGSARLLIAADDIRARQIADEACLYHRDVFYYPARDMMFYQADLSGNLLIRERMKALKAMLEIKDVTIVTTFDALMEKTAPASFIKNNILKISKGDTVDLEELSGRLLDLGYERLGEAEEPGQYAVRGGIIDIYPLTSDNPVRIELWGDETDSIREYDALSQRSIEKLESVTIFPATDIVTDRDMRLHAKVKIEEEGEKLGKTLRKAMKTEAACRMEHYTSQTAEALVLDMNINMSPLISYLYDKTETLLDHLKGRGCFIFIDEPARCEERANAVWQEWSDSAAHRIEAGFMLPGEAEVLIPGESVFERLMTMPVFASSMISMHHESYTYIADFAVNSQGINSYNKSFDQLTSDLERYRQRKSRVVILSPSHTRAKKLTEDLTSLDINAFYSEDGDRVLSGGEIMVSYGNLAKGYEFPDIGFAVISESDIFGGRVRKKRRRQPYSVLYGSDSRRLCGA